MNVQADIFAVTEPFADSPPVDPDASQRGEFEIFCEPEPADDLLADLNVPPTAQRRHWSRRHLAFAAALALSTAVHGAGFATMVYLARHVWRTPPQVRQAAATLGGMAPDADQVNSLGRPPWGAQAKARTAVLPPQIADTWTQDEPFQTAVVNHAAEFFSDDPADNTISAPERSAPIQLPHVAMSPAVVAPAVPAASAEPVATPPRIATRHGNGGNGQTARNGYDERGLAKPDYPADCKRRHQQGLVLLDVEIRPDGTPGAIRVLKDPGFAPLVDAAINAVRESPFEPATENGSPVAGHLSVAYRFVLER
jgi:TonB family protein